jgi:type IV pilus assembly protein PilB
MLTAQNDTQSTDQVVASPVGSAPSAQFIPTNSFLDVLFEKKQLTVEQIEGLRKDGLSSGKSYEVLIREKDIASEALINEAKAVFNHLGYIDLGEVGIDPEALGLLDESIAKRYKVLPFALDKEKNSIKIAMLDPLDLPTIEFLRQKTNRDVEAYYADTELLQRLIVERYSQNLSTEVDEALRTTNQYQQKAAGGVAINNSGQILRDAPINRIVENILDFAISSRASDVHIEPQGSNIRVRYRIDGILVEKLILPKNVHEAVISRIKIMSNLKIDEKRLPQDGRFNYVSSNKEVDLRVSTLPTVHGEKVVMRLLEKNATVPSLQDLGLTGLALRRLMNCIKIPQGIILITGPTGSGKTTTLYSVLHMINNVGVNIMTLEDPVEYQIPGISQVQVNPKAGLTFASGLRSFLRQDPDIIMVGEIRDNETADLALQASLTGHLVFATLHTNSAAGALPRLLDMGAEPFLLSSSMLLTLGQRVVRRINPKYKEEYKPEPEVVENIKQVLGPLFLAFCKENNKDPENIVLYRPMKERPTNEPDFKGRVAIFEVMSITPEISQLIMKRSPESTLEEVALKQGMILMKQDGYLKALGGVTTVEEVLRVADVK